MAKANEKFERVEKKFWMSAQQYEEMHKILLEHMTVDKFGLSRIRNIYCDSDDYYLIRKSIEKPKFKEKLRVRSYGEFKPDANVYVEIKRKVVGVGYKRRTEMTFAQAQDMLDGKEVVSSNPQISRELQEFVNRYHPKLKVYLTYDRVALFGKDDADLRVTLDNNIRYMLYTPDLDMSQEGNPVLDDPTRTLMEVKALGGIPKWMADAMSELKIYQAPFSKIGTTFTKFIAPTLKVDKNRNIVYDYSAKNLKIDPSIIVPKSARSVIG